MLIIYKFFANIFSPFASIYLKYRILKKKGTSDKGYYINHEEYTKYKDNWEILGDGMDEP